MKQMINNHYHRRCAREIVKFIKACELSPIEINNGFCGMLSNLVVNSMLPLDDEFLATVQKEIYESFTDGTSSGHCWITCYDKHFDAECLEGVNDPHDLPWFKRNPSIRIEYRYEDCLD